MLDGDFHLRGSGAQAAKAAAVDIMNADEISWKTISCLLLPHEYPFFFTLQDTEIINTAILTGRTVAIPVKMVSIEMNGAVTDVSTFVQCKSANEDIVKVP